MIRHVTIAAAILFIAGAAHAQSETVVVTKTVHVGDLDPSTPHGARAIEARLRRTAGDLCGQTHSPLTRGIGREIRRCRSAAFESAMAEYAAQQSRLAEAPAARPVTIVMTRP